MRPYKEGMVSMIVPTFFSEKYLERCLLSVVNQSYPLREVIICNGNSTDATWEIAGEFVKTYDFVKRIRQTGTGVSNARNEGMREAAGEYIQFVDSDDFLMPDATQTLVRAMVSNHADMVMAGFRILKSGQERTPAAGVYENAAAFVEQRFAQAYGYRTNFVNTPWNKLYRRTNRMAHFPEDLSLGEDLIFNLEMLRQAKGIVVIPDVIYEYNNLNENSLMHQFWKDGIAIETRLHRAVKRFVKECLGKGNQKKEINAVIRENYLHALHGKCYAYRCALLHRDRS